MLTVDPNSFFQGKILIIAPHMDDEALACGGLITKLSQKDRIHIVYATDGMKSPAPILPGVDSISSELGKDRVNESIAAMAYLGIPKENLHFLCLPEAQLRKNINALKESLIKFIHSFCPDYVFIPFRYDRHPDHLAINQVVTEGFKKGKFNTQIIEYFVYYRWRLLPKRDIRSYVKKQYLMAVDISDVTLQKRKALDFFKSQTSIYYPWQTRPILTSRLLDEESSRPEFFLVYHPSLPGSSIFTKAIVWIRIVHRLEPLLTKWKYLAGALYKRAFLQNANSA